MEVVTSYRDRLRTPEGSDPYTLQECIDVVTWEQERRGVPAPAPDTSLVAEQFRLYGKMCKASEAYYITGELKELLHTLPHNELSNAIFELIERIHKRNAQE
jgi:hypothetical protein